MGDIWLSGLLIWFAADTTGPGVVLVLPSAITMAGTAVWEIEHGWDNMKNGLSPDKEEPCQK
jgi:hypothetical protein